ncbi:MAG: hypothetical protein ACP5N2_04115 [Candidatus Nanoarchaeia archaeon]
MKLRYYGFLLSALTILNLTILILMSKNIPLTKASISRIGSIESNYFLFFTGTTILVFTLSLFLHMTYKKIKQTPRLEVYLISIISIIGLLFKVGDAYTFERIAHNLLFMIAGLLTLIVILDINQKYLEKKIITNKSFNSLPKIAIMGMTAIFLVLGLNVITEIIYLGAVLSWVNVIGAKS